MRLWCYFFGHRLKRPKVRSRGFGVFTTCKRCGTFMVRDYYDGWQKATPQEKSYYLRAYGTQAQPEQSDGEGSAL